MKHPGILTAILLSACVSSDRIALDDIKRNPTQTVEMVSGDQIGPSEKKFAIIEFLGAKEDEFKAIRYLTAQAKKAGAKKMVITQEEFQKWVGWAPTVAVKYKAHLY